MTSEEKAAAWEWAAIELESTCEHLDDDETNHVQDVIIPHLLKQAERIRSGKKARREMRSR